MSDIETPEMVRRKPKTKRPKKGAPVPETVDTIRRALALGQMHALTPEALEVERVRFPCAFGYRGGFVVFSYLGDTAWHLVGYTTGTNRPCGDGPIIASRAACRAWLFKAYGSFTLHQGRKTERKAEISLAPWTWGRMVQETPELGRREWFEGAAAEASVAARRYLDAAIGQMQKSALSCALQRAGSGGASEETRAALAARLSDVLYGRLVPCVDPTTLAEVV